MASVGVMVSEIGWQGKKQEESASRSENRNSFYTTGL